MSVGFVMLAHGRLTRAGQVARHLAQQGAPVTIHVDARTDPAEIAALETAVSDQPEVRFVERRPCDWGTWALVAATLDACRDLLDRAPELSHVYLVSGQCIPLTSVAQVRASLETQPDVDWIESVSIRDVTWTTGGLEAERFAFSFPFPWKRQRWLFDRWVAMQRRLGRSRTPPDGLAPHMGSQWWCLTATTLRAILSDPDLDAVMAYFRKVWIPDESFFQTMARKHSDRLSSRPLTFARFDSEGRPHLFYDDHLSLLMSADAFFARKVWSGADELYDHFLGPVADHVEPDMPVRVDQELARTQDQRDGGRPGLVNVARYPRDWADTLPTAAPYTVLHGYSQLYRNVDGWFARLTGDCAHGHLFAEEGVEFAGLSDGFVGNLSTEPALRDYDPAGFLRNLVWSTRGEPQAFLYRAEDTAGLPQVFARDPNAEVWMITGAWVMSLTGDDFGAMCDRAAELQRREAEALEVYRQRWTRARVRVWSLADAIAAPQAPLRAILERRMGRAPRHLAEMPEMRELAGLPEWLDRLRDAGVTPSLAGDVARVVQRGSRPSPLYGSRS